MSRIKGKNTKPEMLVRKFLHANGFRYRLHVKGLPGKPDIVLPKYKTVIFVHGCFWHQHKKCRLGKIPKNNKVYWVPKLEGNVVRHKRTERNLKSLGWKSIVIWECGLNSGVLEKNLTKVKRRLLTQNQC